MPSRPVLSTRSAEMRLLPTVLIAGLTIAGIRAEAATLTDLPAPRSCPESMSCKPAAIKADPGLVDAYLAKGYYIYHGTPSVDAVTAYDAAIHLAPFDWRGYAGKAQALRALANLKDALFESEIAVGLAPGSPVAAQ